MSQTIVINKVTLSNGETIGYREIGNGNKILVLVHGNMTSSKHFEILMEELKEDYKIYAMDLRGFGLSSYNARINSLKDFSEDLKEWVDILGLKRFSLAGWSTGGGVIMQFAADHQEYVEKLVLIESVGIKGYPMFIKDENGQPILTQQIKTREEIAADPIQVVPVLDAYASKNKEYMKMLWNMVIYTHNKPSEELYDEYVDDMFTQRNLVDVDYALVVFNISEEHNGVVEGNSLVNKIEVPTLVLQGDRDYVVPRYMGEGIAEGIGENAKLVIIENCGHSPLVDAMPVLVKEIKEFI
ncbi:alpha/beta fold hydrolase [Desnuesiella massiliensis]|uniref:intracellular short-chain-length polyhydroxyalkanoate depolymerase n=1 Tax=Desnuesiella massiliensis TaxID=1650662 RepID=UPI0006E3C8AE|nr:alpha/beta hydrolase [Desnuesiella massiliensis]